LAEGEIALRVLRVSGLFQQSVAWFTRVATDDDESRLAASFTVDSPFSAHPADFVPAF
jgi:hypothetical protein